MVARSLPKGSALLEFARIDMFNFKAKGKEKKWQPAHYLAFVLHAGKGDQVGMIDLGDAQTIDKAVARFKKEIADIRDLEVKKASKISKKLYRLAFAPLKKELRNVKQIFISPDGNLNLIPFEVLQRPDGKYLIEDYSFNYLAAGRDILGFGATKARGAKAVIIGDPDFDLGAAQKAAALRKLALGTGENEQTAKRSMDMRGLHFQRLPGTRKEAEAIWRLIGKDNCELYLDQKALEEVLEQKRTPSILHLATHGFFLSDMDFADLVDDTMARGVMGIKALSRPSGRKFKIENPLLRSGIALAGANSALMNGDFEKTGGIVTAEKILGLRLRGTDLVVLSACDTGLGEVQSGEGVFGLRRAFTQAGTRSLVMSMWGVPDKETKELMVAFYTNSIKGGMNRCEALRQAALKQMQVVKKRYGSAHPAYWGGFIFMGQPR
jgi:CHAT domain-containing protein